MEVKGFCSVPHCQIAQQATAPVTPWLHKKNWMSVLSLYQIEVQKCSDFFLIEKKESYSVLAASDQHYDNCYSAKAGVCLVANETKIGSLRFCFELFPVLE